ncbi:MAG: hypothetical protein JXR78_14750 [Victivallales bacterium]|nr:hypothetical protein [Victivallales bacterium]
MTGKTERRMAMDCGRAFPGLLDYFPASSGIRKKNRNVENRNIDFVNKKIKRGSQKNGKT